MDDMHVAPEAPIVGEQPTSPMPEQPSYQQPSFHQPRKRSKLVIIIAATIVVLAGLGGGAYWWLSRHQQAAQPTASNTSTSDQDTSQPTTITPDQPTETTAGHYVSNGKDLNLSFDYPTSWSVTPPTNSNTADQAITLTSPTFSFSNASGKSVTGKVIVMVRPGGSDLTELDAGKANAGQASTQIAYSKPTSAQHQYPYITFIHLDGSANPSSGFEEVIISGVRTFTKDQSILATSFASLDPIVTARFYTCSDQNCGATTPLSITNSTWQNSDAGTQTLGIFQSLQIN